MRIHSYLYDFGNKSWSFLWKKNVKKTAYFPNPDSLYYFNNMVLQYKFTIFNPITGTDHINAYVSWINNAPDDFKYALKGLLELYESTIK